MILSRRDSVITLGIGAIIFALMVTVLVKINGPADYGLRCVRTNTVHECEVLQSSFLGLFGNRKFAIAESSVLGAKTICSLYHVGGRSSPNCTVNLVLKAGKYRNYPVLSYPSFHLAEASTRKLNGYFAIPTTTSIEIKDDYFLSMFLLVGLPMITIAMVLGLRRWQVGRKL